MKKIAIVVPTLKKGGAEKQSILLANALLPSYQVKVFVLFPRSGREKELIELFDGDESDLKFYSGDGIKLLYKFYKDVHSWHPFAMFCYLTYPDLWGPIVGRLCGVKKIYQGLRNANLSKKKLFLEKIGNFFATGAIINNYAGVSFFEKFGIKNQIIIPNCYFSPLSCTVRNSKDTIQIITVGRFVAQKDYKTAIVSVAKAISKNKSIRYKIIGHGVLEGEIRDLIKQYDIEQYTEILINPKGIINHLLLSDIYLSTSLFEGTSNSIMEAMDASLPIIATNVGDNNRLVRDNYNGYLVESGDTEGISQAILRLSDSLSLRNTYGFNSHYILENNFSFEVFRNNYLKVIGDIKM